MSFRKKTWAGRLLTLFLLLFTNVVLSQTIFMKDHTTSGLVGVTNFRHDMKINDQRNDGYVYGVPRFSTSTNDPLIYTADENAAVSGFSKKYPMDDISRMHLISMTNDTVQNGYFFVGPYQSKQQDYLVRLDNSGAVQWAKEMAFTNAYGDLKKADKLHTIQTEDGNILIVGGFNFYSATPASSPEFKLLMMKVNANTGGVMWQYMVESTEMPRGFLPTEVIETSPDNFYVIGGISNYENFILKATISGTSLSTFVRTINAPNFADFVHILSDGTQLIAFGSDNDGVLEAFYIDYNLTTITSLGGSPGQCDQYSHNDHYFANKDIILHNERLAFTGFYQETISGLVYTFQYLAQLSSSGTLVSWETYIDEGGHMYHHNLYSRDEGIISIDHPLTSSGSSAVDNRNVAFSNAGISCDNTPLSINRSQVNISLSSPVTSQYVSGMSYDNLSINPYNFSISEEVLCEDCFLTAEEVGPITTSTGGTTLCGETDITLSAPTGYTYQWFHDGELLVGEVFENLTITDAGTYTVIVTDSEGCTVELVIEIDPGVDVSDIDGTEYCLYLSYPLPDYDGGIWSGPSVIEAAGSYYFSPTSGGSYVLTYCNTDGCCDDATVIVYDPEIEIIDLNGVCEGDCSGSIEVTGDGLNYNWYLYSGVTLIATAGPSTTATFSSLCEGDYQLIMKMDDAPFCDAKLNFSITSGGWHKRTVNTTGTESANDVVTDTDGNVYVVGTFTKTTEVEGGGNPNILVDSDGSTYGTMYLAKYDDCGTLLWAAHSAQAPLCSGRGLILDENSGMVYITGELIQGAMFYSSESADDLCGSGYTQYLAATSGKSGYVAQYDMATGCLYFAEAFSDGVEQETSSITINENSGDIYVGGAYMPSYSGLEEYVFVRKYSPDVASGILNTLNPLVWSAYDNTSGPGQWNRINNMDYDENRNFLYAIGDYRARMAVDASVITHASSMHDAFLLTLRDAGPSYMVFDLRGGNGSNNGFMSGEGVAVNNSTGAVYLTGSYDVQINQAFFFPGINTLTAFSGQSKSYMLAGRIGGAFTPWARNTIASPSSYGWVRGKDVTFKGNQAIFCNEFSGNAMSIAPGGGFGISYPFVGDATGVGHIGLISYTASGTRNWGNVTESVSIYSNDDHLAHAVTFGKAGTAFLAGAFKNTMSYANGVPYSGDLIFSGIFGGYNACVLRIQKSSGDLERTGDSDNYFANEKEELQIALYPNPTSNTFNIELEEALETNVRVVSLTGQVQSEFTFDTRTINVSIDGMASGTYLIHIENAQGATIKPLVVN